MRDKLKELLTKHEGLKLKPYVDTVGKLTIGIGHNLTDLGIPEQIAHLLYEEDIAPVIADLETFPWWEGLSENRKVALADMRFNLGPSRFRGFKNTLRAVADGRYSDAADGMLASKWAKQVKGRAKTLAGMMRKG